MTIIGFEWEQTELGGYGKRKLILIINEQASELSKLQEALAKTERMWRQERDKRVAAEEQVHRMYAEVPF